MQPPHFNGPPGGAPPPGYGAGPGRPGPTSNANQPAPGAAVHQPGGSSQAPGWGQPRQGGPQHGGPQPGYPQAGPPQAGPPQAGPPQARGWGQPAAGAPHGGGWGTPAGPGGAAPGSPAAGGWGQAQPGWGGPGGPPAAVPPGGYGAGYGGGHGGSFGAVARFQHFNRPVKTGPNIGVAILKLGVGGFFLLTLLIGLVAASYQGYGVGLMFGLFLGACCWAVASGVADLMKKKLTWQVSLGIAAGAALLFTAVGPSISTSFQKSNEERVFTELSDAQKSDYFDAYRWKHDYEAKIDKRFQRPEWQSQYYSARVATAAREKDAAALRTIVGEIDKSDDRSELKEPRKEATKAFSAFYDDAKKKLNAGRNSKTADPALREAFYRLLDDLSQATDSTIHVAFVNSVNLDEPKGDSKALRLYRNGPEARRAFPKGAPVIKSGNAFSHRYDQRRRATFIKAMGESFAQVFDSNLVALAPLEEGQRRDDKIVLEVHSNIYRIPDYYNYNRTTNNVKRFAGLLFAIEVSWGFKLYDRSGKVLYAPSAERSLPAEQLRVSRGPNDPLWAMYSVMMDSAYDNFSRKVTGKFGLVPPPEKKFYTYQGG